MPVGRERASPYQPSDRRFLEPVLLDVTAISDLPAVKTALEQEAGLFATLRKGVLVDAAMLREQGTALLARMHEVEQEAIKEAGEPFNMGSPKQIQHILFDRLGLDPALMSAPFIATATDVAGVFIYLQTASWLLQRAAPG
jgi:4-alpha-glucanotransferase